MRNLILKTNMEKNRSLTTEEIENMNKTKIGKIAKTVLTWKNSIRETTSEEESSEEESPCSEETTDEDTSYYEETYVGDTSSEEVSVMSDDSDEEYSDAESNYCPYCAGEV